MDNRIKRVSALANFVSESLFANHRGIIDIDDGFVVYGNDGYNQDQRSRNEVEIVRERLKDLGLPEPVFGVDEAEGYTWVLVYFHEVVSSHREELFDVVNTIVQDAWGKVTGIGPCNNPSAT